MNNTKEKMSIEILEDCLDEVAFEVLYATQNEELYNKIREMIYKAREQINKL